MAEKKGAGAIVGNILKFVIPLVISVGLCYLLFTGIDFHEMTAIIRDQCDFRWIALGFVFSIMAQVFRGYRWGIQLKALDVATPTKVLVFSIFGTYAVNLVFPRLGEVWRSGYIAQRQHAPFTTVFGSMVADRLSDTVAVLLITLLAFLVASKAILGFLDENGESYAMIGRMLASPWLWCAIVLCVAALIFLLKIKTANRVLLKIQKALIELWQGFVVILRMPGQGRWLLYTLGIWASYFLQTYVCFYAFPFTSQLLADYGIQVALVTFVLGSISMGVPSNGGIGPWQWAVMFALGIYGLPMAQAGAWANLVLGTTTLLTIVLGIFTFISIALDKKKTKNVMEPDRRG